MISWQQRTLRSTLVAVSLLLLHPLCARADWLVLKTRAAVETRGPWKVKGNQVVFSDVHGRLVSVRLDTVDLTASERATAAAKAPPPPPLPPPPPPPPRKSIAVITDADIGRAVSSGPVVDYGTILYTTSWCPVCKDAKRYLEALGSPYAEKDVERDPIALLEYRRKSGEQQVRVPLIEIDGKYSIGLDRRWIDERLRERATLLEKGAETAEVASAEAPP